MDHAPYLSAGAGEHAPALTNRGPHAPHLTLGAGEHAPYLTSGGEHG